YFRVTGIFENEVYDGIEEMLRSLKNAGKQILLATSKPEEFAKRILEHFHLMQYFDFVAGATMDGTRCKKGEIIQYAIDNYPVESLSNAVMVGDREHDILGARQVGMDSIGVLYGYGDYEELSKAGANYIAKEVMEILNFV
ncbi:MAG: HAD-IA family hydrolase, partial [Lachnospiraceae bacterium]